MPNLETPLFLDLRVSASLRMRRNSRMAAFPHSNSPMCCSTALGHFHGINILDIVLAQEKPSGWSPLLEEVTMAISERDLSTAEEGGLEVAYNFGCLALCPAFVMGRT